MKRRIQKVKKFELLISTSTYELQLHNGYIFIFYFKIWQLVYCITFKDMTYLRCYNIWISFYRRYNNVTGLSASLRALNFILFEISIVCIFILLTNFGYMTIYFFQSNYFFLKLSEYILDCIQPEWVQRLGSSSIHLRKWKWGFAIFVL